MFEVLLLILGLGAAQKLLALWIGDNHTFLDQPWLKVRYFFDVGDIIVLGRFIGRPCDVAVISRSRVGRRVFINK